MDIVCLDLEGVLVPEIWVEFAKVTGIDELRATTRDISDYDVLMQQRIEILRQHKLTVDRIQTVIASLTPLDGAVQFLEQLRARAQVVILSDTFYEFAQPLMLQLGSPTLLCHRLAIDKNSMITGYHLRQTDPKRKSVIALQSLNYTVRAAGDSYNDITMLEQADRGVLFHSPDSIAAEYPQFMRAMSYDQLLQKLFE
ncbi:bifunctional phosphoserine phosphatase/homoserine phosphotransferase ThrH [Eionea flava]